MNKQKCDYFFTPVKLPYESSCPSDGWLFGRFILDSLKDGNYSSVFIKGLNARLTVMNEVVDILKALQRGEKRLLPI